MSARSLNRVMLIGNLTRDPELRYTPSGTAVCTFGLATNRTYSPADSNEVTEETEFHRIVAWGKLAEICGQLLYKGRKVYCDGRIQTRKWTGQDGQERVTTEIVIDNMIALSPPRGRGGEEYESRGGGYQGRAEASQPAVVASEEVEASEAVEEKPAKKKTGKDKKAAKADEAKATAEVADQEVDMDDIPF